MTLKFSLKIFTYFKHIKLFSNIVSKHLKEKAFQNFKNIFINNFLKKFHSLYPKISLDITHKRII